MDGLADFIAHLLSYMAGSFIGTVLGLIVYGGITFLLFMMVLWIQNRFFPDLKDNKVFNAIMVIAGGVIFWILAPIAFWHFVFKIAE